MTDAESRCPQCEHDWTASHVNRHGIKLGGCANCGLVRVSVRVVEFVRSTEGCASVSAFLQLPIDREDANDR